MSSLPAVYLNLMVRLLVSHLMSTRPSPWRGHHLRLVIDEAQLAAPVLGDVAESILTTGRSRGISLVLASQGTALIKDASDTLLKVILTNTPTKVIGRLSIADAELLARERGPSAGAEESISSIRTRFASSVANLPDREFFHIVPGAQRRFTARHEDMDAWARALAVHADEIEAAKTRFALPENQPPRVRLSDVVPIRSRERSRPSGGPPPRAAARSRWG